MKICDFTKPELDKFREECNFTEIESRCFELKAKDYTNIQLALELSVSESTVAEDVDMSTRQIHSIVKKYEKTILALV